ncbi:MAG: phosphate acyltransferase PlsX [Ruminococcaceae bacterium]|nr:phosphate acyltransferase PlsX [Oscillospiraceae bacterium]
MKIIVDCMSGDHAPLEIVKGAIAGANAHDTDVLLVGDEHVIRKIIRENALSEQRVSIYHTPDDPVLMTDDPGCVVRDKKDSSMGTALRLLAEGKGDAVISAGNTGALFTGATLIVKRIKGMRRAALGAIVPITKPMLIVDSGANIDVLPEHLLDFALMGSLYMKKVAMVKDPKVGLINNGEEEKKGTELYVKAHQLLKNADINFVGNIEGREVPSGVADVIVCDGFTGNIVLKLCEGFGLFLKRTLNQMFRRNTVTKMGAVFVSESIKKLKKQMDYSEHGGAPFLGISKPVIKAHGSSNARSISFCVLQAKNYAASGIIDEFYKLAQDKDKYIKGEK